jgi:hypothetical protein
VGVRADLGGGSVHASLVPGSAEAAQMLGSHLAGLNDYLAERHSAVSPVTMAGHEGGGSSSANAQSGSGANSGSHSGSQSSAQQDSAGNANSGNSSNPWTPQTASPAATASDGGAASLLSNSHFPAANTTAETSGKSSGSYVSVMA